MGTEGALIRLCGRLSVEIGGESREGMLHGRQGRLLLAFLVLHRHRPTTRDQLIDAIWGHDRVPPSEGALAPVLSRLRRALNPATIEGRDGVILKLPEPAWVDVEAAHVALTRARETTQPGETLDYSQKAVTLVEAGLLPGLEAPWLGEQRTAIEHLRVEALELAANAARTIDPSSAERFARAAIAAAPFRESAWAALIAALGARGNVAEALHAYEDVRRLLRDELGAAPGRELAALHTRLLSESDEPPEASSVQRPPHKRVGTAPTPRTPSRTKTSTSDLVEREDELRAVDDALGRVRSGEGGVVLFEGPAGIGKTRLLDELGLKAHEQDLQVLQARAGLLEREFAFGVVRQLLEPVAEPELMDGPAAAARAVLSDAGPAEGTFPVLNGLFRLVENLARQTPLALCVDDLQWSDPASLRFTAYLARRVAKLPVLIAATIRTGEPDADEALLGALAQEPVTLALNPRPLTPHATAQLIRGRLNSDPDQAFTGACQEVTAGNPLLLRQLLNALSSEAVVPDATGAADVRAIGPRAVARTVLLRLARLQDPAVAVARAVAVLGEQPGLPAIAGLAGVDEAASAEAVQTLVRAEILRADEPLGFVHPLIRDAVYTELPAPVRAREHERAARLLADLSASPERVAAQLLLAPPRGDAWVVTRLREAAHVALRRGAPDAAMRLLERAQAEPPPADQQAALAFELGGSAAYLRGPAGVEPLQRAYAELTDPAERARAAIRLSHLLLFVRSPQEGVALAAQAADELPAGLDDFRDGLRAVRLVGAAFGAVDPAEFRALDDVRRGPRGTGPGARALTAMTALAVALTCGPADEASALAREAFSAGLEAFEITAPVALASAVLALGEPSEGLQAIERYAEHARRQGEILGSIGADLWGGIAQLWAGDLRGAMALLERAHEGERLWGTKLDAVMAYSAGFTALVALERGDRTDAVAETLHRVQAEDPRPDGARFWLASLTELALAEDRPADALEITRRLEPARPPDTHPLWAPWRSLRARALAQLGEVEQARQLALEDLELARRVGAQWVIGRGLRILAELESGTDRLAPARDAVAHLARTSARLELAKAQVALAVALGPDRDPTAAQAAWTRAHELAIECGANGLAQHAARNLKETRAA
jgi:DNA-binding SARP family transcriptional activator/tetratricopeptide (TPR) repeat protein